MWFPLISSVAVTGLTLYSAAALVLYARGQVDHAAPADLIVILGGGVYPDGSPTSAQIRRVQHAVALYQRGLAPLVLCTGGYDTPHHTKSEAAVCAKLLESQGIPASAILIEEKSQSTEENAIETHKIMDGRHLKTALLVSDNFHLVRARLIFLEYKIPVAVSPAQATTGPLNLDGAIFGSFREVAAFGWYTIKHALHLPFTNTRW